MNNMNIEDITNILNKYLENKRTQEKLNIKGHFVVKRNIETMKPPIYKKFIIELYYVTPVQDKEIFTIINTDKCPSGSECIYWKNLSKEYLLYVFNLIRTETFNKLIYGSIN